MSMLCFFMISCLVQFCQSQALQNVKSTNKQQDGETFTTIFLDDEAYSLKSVDKKLHKQPSRAHLKENESTSLGKLSKTNTHRLKGNKLKSSEDTHVAKEKPNLSVTRPKTNTHRLKGNKLKSSEDTHVAREKPNLSVTRPKTNTHRLKRNKLKSSEDTHVAKETPNLSVTRPKYSFTDKKSSHHSQKEPNKVVHHQKRSDDKKKKLKKRNFDLQRGYDWNLGQSDQRYEDGNRHYQNYRFAVQPTDLTPTTWQVGQKVTENVLGISSASNAHTSENLPKEVAQRNSDGSLWGNYENSGVYRPARQPQTTNSVSNFGTLNKTALSLPGYSLQDYSAFSTHQETINPTWKWPVSPISSYISSFYASLTSPAAVMIRNPPSAIRQKSKSEKEKLEEQLRSEESDVDDTNIVFGCRCDQIINETCWLTREIGDVVTLSLEIRSSKSPSSFQVRWLRVHHMYNSKKGKPLEIAPGKLPWNMVSGSDGRELRLDPVTNIDLDPNYLIAKVFLLTKQRGKVLFTHMKKLIFRIDIPIIDMGKLYAGEEVTLNLENFISLPEKGNLLFDWSLERRAHEALPLPSNVKISSSGRTLILKELKKGKFGVLNCVVYSSNRYAVAKRRFNVLEVAENLKRRSTVKHPVGEKSSLKRSIRCRRVIMENQEKTMQRLEAGAKSKSRKKRFKRMRPGVDEIDCEPMRKKIYSRWIRSLFGDYTTTDSRLMPLDRLFELSEEGDGTLDDVIPHEVHYVKPQIRLLHGTAGERSINQVHSPLNCTSDADCGRHSVCAMPQTQQNATDPIRYCFCRPEFYGDGLTCRKIPSSHHREKRVRRNTRKDFVVPKHLFYEQVRRTPSPPTTQDLTAEEKQVEENLDMPPKILAFEEEESFLLSECIDDRDCSVHGSCVQPSNGHPFCKCRSGYPGNGIFCWAIMDYVPPEEEFLPEEEINPKGQPTNAPGSSINHLPTRTPAAEEMDEFY